ncbi:hypothetical protein D3C81_1846400 [compost metagenome]
MHGPSLDQLSDERCGGDSPIANSPFDQVTPGIMGGIAGGRELVFQQCDAGCQLVLERRSQ